MRPLIFFLVLITTPVLLATGTLGLQSQPPPRTKQQELSRRAFAVKTISTALIGGGAIAARHSFIKPANAVEEKQLNLSNDQMAAAITKDIQERQFMVNGDITRSLYSEDATFTDEIDTYQLDPWVKGTKALFVGDKSHVSLDANTLQVTDEQVTYRFTESLMFNIPFRPVVHLTGSVILKRDPSNGLITSYQEKWDQSISKVLTSAKFSF